MEQKNTHHSHHLVPLRVYFNTIGALICLTILTVAAAYMDFGAPYNVIVALGIACAKASLVLLFFMGLKYDTALNRTFISSSFIALFILLSITASDLWTRPSPKPATVKSAAGVLTKDQFEQLLQSTPDQIAKGKALFAVNCAVCHGPNGMGDGIGGAALNPKPRNFHGPLSAWVNGDSTKSMYVTLTYGIPGSGMASYKALPPKDRLALIHFVHTFVPQVEAEGKADSRFEQAEKEDGIGGGGAAPVKAVLPIDFAMQRVLKD